MALCVNLSYGQTQLADQQNFGSVKVWTVRSADGATLGSAYSIEKTSKPELRFSPKRSELEVYTLVVTGTYTSTNNQVAGEAYNGVCDQIGNTADPYFKPNSYLAFTDKSIQFANNVSCNSIGVYKVVDDSILYAVVNARTKKSLAWRFLVEKTWKKDYFGGVTNSGRDLFVIDFESPMTLSEACAHVQGLGRKNKSYYDAAVNESFTLTSKVVAVLLDTGTFRPFLLQGKEVHGKFPEVQSNVIVVR